jgi:hypothetical protein
MNKIIETDYSRVQFDYHLEFTSFLTLSFPYKTKIEVQKRAKYKKESLLAITTWNQYLNLNWSTWMTPHNYSWSTCQQKSIGIFTVNNRRKVDKTKRNIQLIHCYWRKFNKQNKKQGKASQLFSKKTAYNDLSAWNPRVFILLICFVVQIMKLAAKCKLYNYFLNHLIFFFLFFFKI